MKCHKRPSARLSHNIWEVSGPSSASLGMSPMYCLTALRQSYCSHFLCFFWRTVNNLRVETVSALSESLKSFSCLVESDSLWPPWTTACQASLSMGFSRQEYWSGLPCPPPGDLPEPQIEPGSPAWQWTLPLSYQGSPSFQGSIL